jgi:hypothetical protein
MATIVRCNCGAEYKRTEAKFLVPHTGHASCKVCGATLESWLESTHVATFELVKHPDGNRVELIFSGVFLEICGHPDIGSG